MKPSTRKVLVMLQRHPEGVTTGEFMANYIGRAPARMGELRELHGCVIDSKPVDPKQPRGPQRYTLVSGPRSYEPIVEAPAPVLDPDECDQLVLGAA